MAVFGRYRDRVQEAMDTAFMKGEMVSYEELKSMKAAMEEDMLRYSV
jgi:hypothetical protein